MRGRGKSMRDPNLLTGIRDMVKLRISERTQDSSVAIVVSGLGGVSNSSLSVCVASSASPLIAGSCEKLQTSPYQHLPCMSMSF